ncbi:MAG: glycosyltransferase family 2 protein [Bacteroidales bacterium]|nr:glycosyltransferase family 2 protein [Bacteroidales bacterium]
MPSVSVIVPVFNAEAFLDKCLESLAGQTLEDIEVICVDDHSTDISLAILKERAVQDSRFKVIPLDCNQGPSKARNAALDAALGEFVAFVDSDDFVSPDFLEKLYGAAVSQNADVAKGTLLNYDPVKGASYQREIFNLNYRIREHKAWFFMTYTSAIYRTGMLRAGGIRFDERLRFFEDPHFSITAAFHYNKVVLVDDAVYYYTDNPHSVTHASNDTRPIRDLIAGANDLLDKMDALGIEGRHYNIVFAFLIDQFAGWFQKYYAPDAVTELAASGFSGIVQRCRDFQACMSEYLFFRKESDRRNLIRQIKKDLHG